MREQVHTYDSVSEFVRDTPKFNESAHNAYWVGMPLDEAQRAVHTGHEASVVGAERFLALIERELQNLPTTVGFETVRDVFGPRADMGDWMMGAPNPCRRRVRRDIETAPLKIVVNGFVSAGINTDQLRRRGEAIMALLMAIQSVRPVDLYAAGESTHTGTDGWRYFLIRLESRPLSLSQAGFIIGHPAFFRTYGIGWFAAKNPDDTSVPWLGSTPAEQRERLGLEPQDILIEKASLGDALLSDPLAWVRREIAKIMPAVA